MRRLHSAVTSCCPLWGEGGGPLRASPGGPRLLPAAQPEPPSVAKMRRNTEPINSDRPPPPAKAPPPLLKSKTVNSIIGAIPEEEEQGPTVARKPTLSLKPKPNLTLKPMLPVKPREAP